MKICVAGWTQVGVGGRGSVGGWLGGRMGVCMGGCGDGARWVAGGGVKVEMGRGRVAVRWCGGD